MAVRKIPLEEHGYFSSRLASEVHGEESPVDPAVLTYLTQTREVVLKDRALHDKVCISQCDRFFVLMIQ